MINKILSRFKKINRPKIENKYCDFLIRYKFLLNSSIFIILRIYVHCTILNSPLSVLDLYYKQLFSILFYQLYQYLYNDFLISGFLFGRKWQFNTSSQLIRYGNRWDLTFNKIVEEKNSPRSTKKLTNIAYFFPIKVSHLVRIIWIIRKFKQLHNILFYNLFWSESSLQKVRKVKKKNCDCNGR